VHNDFVAIGEADALLGAAYVGLEAIGLVVLDLPMAYQYPIYCYTLR
jgi:hypothetical protein